MLALAQLRAETCPSCGGPAEECLTAEAQDSFVVPPPTRCHRTTALRVAQTAAKDNPHPDALLWQAVPR